MKTTVPELLHFNHGSFEGWWHHLDIVHHRKALTDQPWHRSDEVRTGNQKRDAQEMRNGYCGATPHFHFYQSILKQFLATPLMRNDDVAYLEELLHGHPAFDERMAGSCKADKGVTKEHLLDNCCLHQVWKISDRQIHGAVSQERSAEARGCAGLGQHGEDRGMAGKPLTKGTSTGRRARVPPSTERVPTAGINRRSGRPGKRLLIPSLLEGGWLARESAMKGLALYAIFVIFRTVGAVLIGFSVESYTSPDIGSIVLLIMFFVGLAISWIATVFVMDGSLKNFFKAEKEQIESKRAGNT
jgi:hypothetical protein